MDQRKIFKQFLYNCIPTIISLMLTGLYSVVDGLFIGRANGDIGLAAINIAWPITAVISAIGIGIGSGGSVLMSNHMGKGEKEESEEMVHITVQLLIIISLLVTCILFIFYPYLLKILGARGSILIEAKAYSKVIILGSIFQILGNGLLPILRNNQLVIGAMCSMTVGMIVNFALNYILVLRMDIGIMGAAIGTISAQGVVCAIGMILLYKKKVRIFHRGKRKDEKRKKDSLNRKRVGSILKVGIAPFGLSLAPSVVLIFTNLQCLKWGGSAAVACYAVISYITFPAQSMLSGVGEGSQALVSYYNGVEEEKTTHLLRKYGYYFSILLGTLLFLLVMIFKKYIPSIFGMSGESEMLFQGGMSISALSFLMIGVVRYQASFYSATLQPKKAARMIYAETLFITPLLLYLLPTFMGVYGIWASFSFGPFLMSFIIFLKSKQSKKLDLVYK